MCRCLGQHAGVVSPNLSGVASATDAGVTLRPPAELRKQVVDSDADRHHTADLPCAESNRLLDASPAGTATTVEGWLLIECPGAWGRDVAGTLGEPAATLLARADDAGVRVQLIRTPGSHARVEDRPMRALLAHCGPTPWMKATVTTAAGFDDLPVEQAASARPPAFGDDVNGDVLLVCTHSARDRCCATFGRGLAAALAARRPGQVWETSHVGGHRFAGNLVVLPEGLMFGGLDAPAALDVVDDLAAGRLPLATLRGRCHLHAAAQAAEILARQQLDGHRRDGVSARVEEFDGTNARVLLQVAGGRWQAHVAHRATGALMRLSCDRTELRDPGRWELLGLEPADSSV